MRNYYVHRVRVLYTLRVASCTSYNINISTGSRALAGVVELSRGRGTLSSGELLQFAIKSSNSSKALAKKQQIRVEHAFPKRNATESVKDTLLSASLSLFLVRISFQCEVFAPHSSQWHMYKLFSRPFCVDVSRAQRKVVFLRFYYIHTVEPV